MSETITITGNIGADPERRELTGGVWVTRLRVACTQRRYDRESQRWVDADTNWFSVSAFRTLGDHVAASLRKGDRVVVVGRLRLRQWEGERGRGFAAEIEAEALGPDLRWGTAQVQRGTQSPALSAGHAAAPERAGEDGALPPEPGVAGVGDWGARSGQPVAVDTVPF